jgi:DNA topoisomerase I
MREGRFGVYVTDGETNASLRREDDPKTMAPERAHELLQLRREAGPSAKKSKKKATKKSAKKVESPADGEAPAGAKKAAAKKSAKKAGSKKVASKSATKKKSPAKSETPSAEAEERTPRGPIPPARRAPKMSKGSANADAE